MSHTVDETDVQQAARVLLGCDCAPPAGSIVCRDFSDLSLEDAKKEFAFSLAASASPVHMQHVSALLDGQWAVATNNTVCIDILLSSKAPVQSEDMIKESPLQVAAQQGSEDVVRRLLCAGADPFRSTIEYDSSKASFRFIGEFKRLPKNTRLALQEALYYAVETGQPDCALQLWKCVPDIPWNMYTWTRALECAVEHRHQQFTSSLLSHFWPSMFPKLDQDNIDYCSYVVEGENVYAHRIMLYNASDRFKELLKIPKGNLDITDVSHSTFLAMLHYIYTGVIPDLSVQALCCLYAAAEVHNNSILLEKGENFMLTNLDALITQAKIRDLLKSHSADYYVCAALSKRLSSAFATSRTEKL
ncbi:unnamed protein product [Strongylus vulgaris]|uniref:BTB domain-containing protein n=1 Tax=Strongylus vulgaris TaxID=40348 RepID=A0A3P7L502_STRVU|nr:unnamed protein product [Strongylus vulgaris]